MDILSLPDKSPTGFRFKEERSLYIDSLFQNLDSTKQRKETCLDDAEKSGSCLSVCNETGVFAIVKRGQVVVAWLKDIQESIDELKEYKLLSFPNPVHNFGFSKKGNILFVQLQREAKLSLYSIAALFQNKTAPFQVISLSSVPWKIWTTDEEHLYCGYSSHIEQFHWATMKQQVSIRFPEQVLDLVCSPDGKRVATITKDAKLQLWDEKGKETSRRILSLELPLPKLELFWLHMTTLLIMVHRLDGMLLIGCFLDTNGQIQQVYLYSSPFIETPSSIENGIPPFGMIQVVEEWQIFILGVSYSTDIQVIQKEKDQLYLLLLEEGEEIACPVDEQSRDTYPLSLALDWTNMFPVQSNTVSETKLCAMPRLLLLLNNDMLKYYSVIDSHCTQPCNKIRPPKAPTIVGLTSEKMSISNPSSQEVTIGTRLEIDFHSTEKESSNLDVNSVSDHLLNKMEQLFLETSTKLNNLVDSLPQEVVERKILTIDALYRDCKLQSKKLLQQSSHLHKEWIEQVLKELEDCERMRLEEERILFNTQDQSEISLQDWIHPQWKEAEQQIQQKKHQVQKAIDSIEEFLEKVYQDRKAVHHTKDTSRMYQREKIFQTLYIQRQRLETLYNRFRGIERELLDTNKTSNASSLSKYSKDEYFLPPVISSNGKDTSYVLDAKSLKKYNRLIHEMAMNNGRDAIRPQQQPLDFPKVKQTPTIEDKGKSSTLKQQEKTSTSSPISRKTLNDFSSQLESSSVVFGKEQPSSSLNLSLKAPVEIPTTFNHLSRQTASNKHQPSDASYMASNAEASNKESKESAMNKSDSFAKKTSASSQLHEKNIDGNSHTLDTNLTAEVSKATVTNVQNTVSNQNKIPFLAAHDKEAKNSKNEDVRTNTSVKSANEQQNDNKSPTEMSNVNIATSDESVMRDLEAMDFSNDKQSVFSANAESQRDSVQNYPFGGFSQVTTGATLGSFSGFNSSSSSSFSPSTLPTFSSSTQQSMPSNSQFSEGFGSFAKSPISSPFATNANSFSSSGYQFGSPSSFVSPAVGGFGVSKVSPTTNKTTFGFNTNAAFGSTGSNPFASLAQQAATSPGLGSSASFGSFSSPSSTSNAFVWSQSTKVPSSLPPSFSQMRK